MRTVYMNLLLLFLAGCSTGISYGPAPDIVFDPGKVFRMVGHVQKWHFSFQTLSVPQEDGVRLVVLNSMSIKMFDITVLDKNIVVHNKRDRFPTAAVQAFARFARANLRQATCSDEKIVYKDPKTRAVFEAAFTEEGPCK